MATAGATIQNKIAGFKLQWLQTAKDTNGAIVKCRMWIEPKAFMPVRHLHPGQAETFEVEKGSLKVECDGSVKMLKEGEAFTVPQGQPHQWWNGSDTEELQMIITMTPAKNWETQMEQVFGIMNSKGKMSFLQIMAMLQEYEMYIAGPPLFIQKIMSTVLYPIARLRGLKKFYPEYSN
jgi:mannose-6-phosphate isomerase-like protein (cupin superfamily)